MNLRYGPMTLLLVAFSMAAGEAGMAPGNESNPRLDRSECDLPQDFLLWSVEALP